MNSAQRTGRIIGMLLFLHLAGLIVPFVLLQPLTLGTPSYLANAFGASAQIKLAVVLLLANGLLTIGLTIAACRIVRPYSEAMALSLLAASGIMFLLQAVDNVHVLSMLSLSQRFVEAGRPDVLYETVAAAVGSTRRWAHVMELFAIDCWVFMLYIALLRCTLVPRTVAAIGLSTAVLHFAGVPLRMFLGEPPVTLMAMSMALGHLTLATFLVVRGFPERQHATPSE